MLLTAFISSPTFSYVWDSGRVGIVLESLILDNPPSMVIYNQMRMEQGLTLLAFEREIEVVEVEK